MINNKPITPPDTILSNCQPVSIPNYEHKWSCKFDKISNSIRNKQVRLSGLDIVRTIACVSVIASHFFLYTDFNKTYFSGISMFLQGMLQSFEIGSDLYMILTGFLCCNKLFGLKFYRSGLKVVLSYLVFSILTIIVDIYYFHNGMTWKEGILGIFSFSTIPYAWYIEMWIGLFLLAPFINILYKAIPNKKMKLYLIGMLYLFTALPNFCNRYGMHLVPGFWEGLYPIMFYIIGAFIREYKPRISRLKIAIGILALICVGPVFNLIVYHPTYLHIIGDRNGLICVPLAVLVFLCFYNIELKHEWSKNIFKNISLRSLDIFLCSSVFDAGIYPYFRNHFFVDQSQYGVYVFVIIPLIFLLSFSIATVKRALFKLIERFVHLKPSLVDVKLT